LNKRGGKILKLVTNRLLIRGDTPGSYACTHMDGGVGREKCRTFCKVIGLYADVDALHGVSVHLTEQRYNINAFFLHGKQVEMGVYQVWWNVLHRKGILEIKSSYKRARTKRADRTDARTQTQATDTPFDLTSCSLS